MVLHIIAVQSVSDVVGGHAESIHFDRGRAGLTLAIISTRPPRRIAEADGLGIHVDKPFSAIAVKRGVSVVTCFFRSNIPRHGDFATRSEVVRSGYLRSGSLITVGGYEST